jgi:uncharacterized protein (TIGR02246 family)
MLRKISLIAYVALFLLTVGCSTSSNVPAPPPDTRPADVQAVKDVEKAWVKNISSRDADKFLSYFAQDASALYAGAGILNGKAAIKCAVAPYFADPNLSATFQSTRMVASKGGDMVYSQGIYTLTTTDPRTGEPVTDKGKYLTIYMKQDDGSWKVVADTDNSDIK